VFDIGHVGFCEVDIQKIGLSRVKKKNSNHLKLNNEKEAHQMGAFSRR